MFIATDTMVYDEDAFKERHPQQCSSNPDCKSPVVFEFFGGIRLCRNDAIEIYKQMDIVWAALAKK